MLHYQHGKWIQEQAPIEAMISIHMFSATSGWALGSTIDKGTWGHRQVAVYQNGAWTVRDEPCWGCQVTFSSLDEGWAWGVPNSITTVNSKSDYAFWHYQHGKWTITSFPGLDASSVIDMAFTSQADGWAFEILYSSNLPATSRLVLFHYDGTSWNQVDIPANVPIGDGWAIPLTLVSHTEFWVLSVTDTIDPTKFTSETLLHYKDGAWSSVVLPANETFSTVSMFITGISAFSSDDVWIGAEGQPGSVIGHYHNGTWTIYQ